MDKAILVIDMPNCCNECKIRFDDEYSNWCPCKNPEENGVWKYVENGTKPDWCPLKQLPEHKLIWQYEAADDYERGYNACLDEILDD